MRANDGVPLWAIILMGLATFVVLVKCGGGW